MQIRDTSSDDIAAVAAIYDREVRDETASFELDPPDEPEMRRRWQALLQGGYPHVVAERDGGILGYAYAGPYRPRAGYRFTVENSVHVIPEAQQTGVGRALMTEVIHRCTDMGFRQMVAVIGGGTGHAASFRLHEALGFRVVGTIAGAGYKHGRWLDTLLMQRQLGPGNGAPPAEMPAG